MNLKYQKIEYFKSKFSSLYFQNTQYLSFFLDTEEMDMFAKLAPIQWSTFVEREREVQLDSTQKA